MYQQIPLADVVAGIANKVATKQADEQFLVKVQKFRDRCSREILLAANRGEKVCNFAYYSNEASPVILNELIEKGYRAKTETLIDDSTCIMIIIHW